MTEFYIYYFMDMNFFLENIKQKYVQVKKCLFVYTLGLVFLFCEQQQ